MGHVVDAAAGGGESLLIFSLTVAGVMIFLLLATVVWFGKARIRVRERYETTLEKRLSAGTDKMAQQTIAIEQLQARFIELLGEMLKRQDFEEFRKEHKREHERLGDKVDGIQLRSAELAQRVESGIHSMKSMLSSLVDDKLRRVEGEKT